MSLHMAFSDLVHRLQEVERIRAIRILDEGAVLVDLAQPLFHEEIVIYLLAGELSVGFVKKTLNANTQRDIHTLFIVSLDLISHDGVTAHMSEGLRLLLQAYGGKVHTYRLTGDRISIVPVFIGRDRKITCGEPVDLSNLCGDYATFDNKYLLGVRKVAGFSAQQFQGQSSAFTPHSADPLQVCYELLGVAPTASRAEVKRAYRVQARRHHPDADKSPNATAKMQNINEAYRKIMERLRRR